MEMSVRILHISHTDIRYDSRILKEASAIADINGCDVYAIGVDRREGSAMHTLDSRLKISSLSLYARNLKYLPRPLRLMIGSWIWLALELFIKIIVYAFIVRPKIVHCHDVNVLPAAILIKLFFGSKIVYDAHELESDKNGIKKTEARIIKILEKYAWEKIDLFISVSPSIIKWYENTYGPKKSILVLNAPELSKAFIRDKNKKNTYFHSLYDIPNDELVFVYLGLLTKGRGIDIYLDAFKNLKVRSHIVFVGYGELSTMIKNASYESPRIHMHEPVAHDKVVELVSAADVGLCLVEKVSLSDYYCLPNKLFEYVFSDLRIIASKFPDIEEIVKRYNMGLCCDPDSKSFIDSIIAYEKGEVTGSVLNVNELSWSSQKIKIITAYKDILNDIKKPIN